MGTTIERLPRYLTTIELSKVLGMSLEYIYANARGLGGINVGRAWRFPENRLPGHADRPYVEPKLGRPRKHPLHDD